MNDHDPVRIVVTDVLDLHSVPPRDVKAVVEEYLNEAQRLSLKALRIIHGRGIGVQRQTVRAVLARTPFVLTFRDAPSGEGGWGATVVDLVNPGSPVHTIMERNLIASGSDPRET